MFNHEIRVIIVVIVIVMYPEQVYFGVLDVPNVIQWMLNLYIVIISTK